MFLFTLTPNPDSTRIFLYPFDSWSIVKFPHFETIKSVCFFDAKKISKSSIDIYFESLSKASL